MLAKVCLNIPLSIFRLSRELAEDSAGCPERLSAKRSMSCPLGLIVLGQNVTVTYCDWVWQTVTVTGILLHMEGRRCQSGVIPFTEL